MTAFLTKTILLGTSLVLLHGCYHVRVNTAAYDPSTTYQSETVHTLFWGLVQEDVIASNCDSLKIKGLDEVRVTTNFGYSLITVLTLGIWCPTQIEWKCSKPCQREGEL
ncbi:MAG TPA: hypothetical protein VK147_06040 [Candidatus Didemnitutus sp.]|nr:hypothetical protein [Candidatus Didemnitutus sp.]